MAKRKAIEYSEGQLQRMAAEQQALFEESRRNSEQRKASAVPAPNSTDTRDAVATNESISSAGAGSSSPAPKRQRTEEESKREKRPISQLAQVTPSPAPPHLLQLTPPASAATAMAASTSTSGAEAPPQLRQGRVEDPQSILVRFKEIEAKIDKDVPFIWEAYGVSRQRRICEAVSPYMRDPNDHDARRRLVQEFNWIYQRCSGISALYFDRPTGKDECLKRAILDLVTMRWNGGRSDRTGEARTIGG